MIILRKKNILLYVVAIIILIGVFGGIYNKFNNIKNDNPNISEVKYTGTNLVDKRAKIVSKITSSQNTLSITLNGMLDEAYMEEILNLLNEYNIKATFFFSGTRVAEEPDIAKKVIGNGHTLGNYTLTQKKNFEELSIQEMKKELSKTNNIFEKNVGITPKYFRCQNSKYYSQVLQVAANYNLQVAVPDLLKVNSSKITTEDEAKKYVSNLKNGDILSINLENKDEIIKGLSLLLKEIKNKNYEVVSIDELVNKNEILYSNSYDEMLTVLENDKNTQNLTKQQYKKIKNENRSIQGTQVSEKKIYNKTTDKKIEDVSNINYELLYNSPIKGSGEVFPYAYTTSKSVALTFDGLGNEEMINGILDALDKSNIKATFFLQGAKVEKNPEIALEILKRGHEIENNTPNSKDMSTIDYQSACKEIGESSEIIKEKLGVKTKYVRPRFGKYNDNFLLAALNTGNEVVTYSKNPLDMDMKDAEKIKDYIKTKITRGEIILLNADKNPEVIKAIPMIADVVRDVGYDFITIDKLYNSQYKHLKLEDIQGHDAIKMNNNFKETLPNVVYNLNDFTTENVGKTVAITFDDWGSDKPVTEILDTLDKYKVKSTFFIRSNGLENNPNLAKAISEAGHDVASHTFSHMVINHADAATIQDDLVKANKALTYAIQRKPEMYFRPPQLEVSDESLKALQAAGYTNIIQGDISTHDYDPNVTEEQIINRVLTETKSGSIIILHMSDNAKGPKVLPKIIEGLQKEGYSFAKISDYYN